MVEWYYPDSVPDVSVHLNEKKIVVWKLYYVGTSELYNFCKSLWKFRSGLSLTVLQSLCCGFDNTFTIYMFITNYVYPSSIFCESYIIFTTLEFMT